MKCEVIDPKHIGLAWNFHVNPSSCANPDHYENYLRLCAINEKNEGLNVTHVFIEDDENGSEHMRLAKSMLNEAAMSGALLMKIYGANSPAFGAAPV